MVLGGWQKGSALLVVHSCCCGSSMPLGCSRCACCSGAAAITAAGVLVGWAVTAGGPEGWRSKSVGVAPGWRSDVEEIQLPLVGSCLGPSEPV
eukprot:1159806-Pelagomonas_calceolata.AAC.2